MSDTFTTVGVVGFGTMGAGIAHVAAAAGATVVVVDVDERALAAGQQRLRGFADAAVARGKVSEADAAAPLARISATLDLSDLASCSLVIESVAERLEVKREVLGNVSAVASDTAIIATNTSSMSVTALAALTRAPERFAGLHFFNPPQLMRLVEVVPGVSTDPAVVQSLSDWARAAGKEPVVVKDQPGFLVNSLFIPYLNHAIREYDDGLASAEDLDAAIRLGLGYPQGPLELLDRIGLDTHLLASTRAYEELADPRFAPPPLLRRLVAAGRLGHKSGSGIRIGEEEP